MVKPGVSRKWQPYPMRTGGKGTLRVRVTAGLRPKPWSKSVGLSSHMLKGLMTKTVREPSTKQPRAWDWVD